MDVSIVTYPAYKATSVELRDGMTDHQRRAVDLAAARARFKSVKQLIGGREWA
jgi:phage head maturation protease